MAPQNKQPFQGRRISRMPKRTVSFPSCFECLGFETQRFQNMIRFLATQHLGSSNAAAQCLPEVPSFNIGKSMVSTSKSTGNSTEVSTHFKASRLRERPGPNIPTSDSFERRITLLAGTEMHRRKEKSTSTASTDNCPSPDFRSLQFSLSLSLFFSVWPFCYNLA